MAEKRICFSLFRKVHLMRAGFFLCGVELHVSPTHLRYELMPEAYAENGNVLGERIGDDELRAGEDYRCHQPSGVLLASAAVKIKIGRTSEDNPTPALQKFVRIRPCESLVERGEEFYFGRLTDRSPKISLFTFHPFG